MVLRQAKEFGSDTRGDKNRDRESRTRGSRDQRQSCEKAMGKGVGDSRGCRAVNWPG